jgi:PEP-CTERM motif-containing protein
MVEDDMLRSLSSGPIVGALALFLWIALPASAADCNVVVYDNTTTPVFGNFTPFTQLGFVPLGHYASDEALGDTVVLAGTKRAICQFDLMLRAPNEPTTLSAANGNALILSFYPVDDDGYPELTPLWESGSKDADVDILTMVTFDVPNVIVPDAFAWAVRTEGPVVDVGPALFDPPTIGWSDPDWILELDYMFPHWFPLGFEGDPAASFGARITAVPEPGTLSLLALCTLAMARGRSRRKTVECPLDNPDKGV